MCSGVQNSALEVDLHLNVKHSGVKPLTQCCQKQKRCQLLSKINAVKAKCGLDENEAAETIETIVTKSKSSKLKLFTPQIYDLFTPQIYDLGSEEFWF